MRESLIPEKLRSPATVLATAVLYYGAGRLSLLLAIPPGYVTGIWLPSGVALALTLLRGKPALLGVWIGAFLVELHASGCLPDTPQMAWVSAIIACGAMMQTAIGAYLVRRFVRFPTPLVEAQDIFLFLLLGGVAGCLINASLSVPLLLAVEKIPAESATLNWATWWLGDAIGVFITAPLIFIGFGQPREIWRPRLLPVGGAILLGATLVVSLFFAAKQRDQRNILTRFFKNADIAKNLAKEELSNAPERLPQTMRWMDMRHFVWWVDEVAADRTKHRAYSGTTPSDGTAAQTGCRQTTPFDAGGRHWLFHAELPQTGYESRRSEPLWEILAGGFFFTGLLGAFALVLTGRTRVVEAQVNERTARLLELNGVLQNEIDQRLRAEDGTRLLNRELEKRVQERTAELEAARLEAESANRAKSAFLANISHEVRTPMNGVLGLAEIMERSGLNYQQREWMKSLKASGETMMRILDDVLDLAKVESGQLTLGKAPFRLRHELDKTMRMLGVRAEQKGLVMHHRVDDAVPDALVGDALRLRQILTNLIGNAIKFTASGSVSVQVALEKNFTDGPNRRVTLHWVVADTGIGISEEQLPRLFSPFAQGDSSITRRFGGTGLGLSISARLAQMMDGRIWAQNRAGGGSVFHLICVLEAAPAPSRPANDLPPPGGPAPASPVGPRRVLVVDDNAVNRMVAQTLLAQHGHQIDSAADGQEAVDLLAHTEFDVILMDIQMPVMDGFEALRQLRKEEAIAKRPPRRVIALTASAMRGDREICLSAGFDGYIGKPFQPNELFDAVELGDAPNISPSS